MLGSDRIDPPPPAWCVMFVSCAKHVGALLVPERMGMLGTKTGRCVRACAVEDGIPAMHVKGGRHPTA